MQAYYSDTFALPLPAGHRFPMAKYTRLRERLSAAAWPQLKLRVPEPASKDQLLLVHDSAYVESLFSGALCPRIERRIGFPYSKEMLMRSRRSVGATIAAARAALADRVGVNLAGGTHHAFSHQGGGFCVFNDCVVAARTLQQEGLIERALIIDLDVHQGDGTAQLCEQDDTIFTFSMHGEKNYPARKQRSDLDIALAENASDEEYLDQLTGALPEVVDRANADLVFYLAGADPYFEDRYGLLGLTKAGLEQRDAMVFECLREHQLPVAVTMAGGYAPNVEDIVDIHFTTVRLAWENWRALEVLKSA